MTGNAEFSLATGLRPSSHAVVQAGSLAIESAASELSVNPHFALRQQPRLAIDTDQSVHRQRRGQAQLPGVWLQLDSSLVATLQRFNLADSILSHISDGCPHHVPPQGAINIESAFLAALLDIGMLRKAYGQLIALAAATRGDAPSLTSISSIVSSTAAALLPVGGMIARSHLGDRWQDAVVLTPARLTGDLDGDERFNYRASVALATLRTIDAMRLLASESNPVSIPGLGELRKPPFNEIFVVLPDLTGAERLDEYASTATFFASLIADSDFGIGARIHQEAPHRSNQSANLTLKQDQYSRIFSVMCGLKVTLDRVALAKRGAQWATCALAQRLVTVDYKGPTLAEIFTRADGLKLSKLDQPGDRMIPVIRPPRFRNLKWTTADLKAFEEEASRKVDGEIVRWKAEREDSVRAAVLEVFSAAESERLALGGIGSLSPEYSGAAEFLKTRISELETRRQIAESETRHGLRSHLDAPAGNGFLWMLKAATVGARLRSAANRWAKAKFDSVRLEVVLTQLKDKARNYELGASVKLEGFCTEARRQTEPNTTIRGGGQYFDRVHGNQEVFEHPIPLITRLCAAPDVFTGHYLAAQVLQSASPSGEVEITDSTLAKAMAALGSALIESSKAGQDGWESFRDSAEEYFSARFLDYWSDVHLSRDLPAVKTALEEAVQTLHTSGGSISRLPDANGKRDQFTVLFGELDESEPQADALKRLVEQCANSTITWATARRQGESAVILAKIYGGLALPEISAFSPDSEAVRNFETRLEAFVSHQAPGRPVFASPFFAQLVAQVDSKVRDIVGSGTPLSSVNRHTPEATHDGPGTPAAPVAAAEARGTRTRRRGTRRTRTRNGGRPSVVGAPARRDGRLPHQPGVGLNSGHVEPSSEENTAS